jgi:transposase
MSRAFKSAIANSFPFADVVIDRFHIAQHLNQQVDNARKYIQNKIRKEKNNKHKVFKIRWSWSLFKNFEELNSSELRTLLKVCDEYPKLGEYLNLKEEFKQFFKIKTKSEASAFIDYFTDLVDEYDIPEFKVFCKTLHYWYEDILN